MHTEFASAIRLAAQLAASTTQVDAMKATDLIDMLKAEFELGRGHSMSIWAVFKSKGWVKG